MSLFNPTGEPPAFINPMRVVNAYLWDTFKKIDSDYIMNSNLSAAKKNELKDRLANRYPQVPFVPLSDAGGGSFPWGQHPFFVYARLIDRPLGPDFWVKQDVFHYALRGSVQSTMEWQAAFHAILDQQDDSAKRINDYNQKHDKVPVFFHSLRVYQIDPTEKWSDSAATGEHITEMMVRTKYHLYDLPERISELP